MPKCWFVLLRFWLRVDNTLIRIREARYFCEKSMSDTVLREMKHVEGTYGDLAKAGAPSSNVRSKMRLTCNNPFKIFVEIFAELDE